MRVAWRIVRKNHSVSAFGGEGARLYGGRWNSPGRRMVYTSGSMALAALETLVHLNPPLFFRYVAFPVRFDDALLETLTARDLPADWLMAPPPLSTQAVGDHWLAEARSAVLEVPSIIIPSEKNYLLNPAHPAFKKLKIGKPQPFTFDPRLL